MLEEPRFDLAPPGQGEQGRSSAPKEQPLSEDEIRTRAWENGVRTVVFGGFMVLGPSAMVIVIEAWPGDDPAVPLLVVAGILLLYFLSMPFGFRYTIRFWAWDLPRFGVQRSDRRSYGGRVRGWNGRYWWKRHEPDEIAAYFDEVCGLDSRPWPWESPDESRRRSSLRAYEACRRRIRRIRWLMIGLGAGLVVVMAPFFWLMLVFDQVLWFIVAVVPVGLGALVAGLPLQIRAVRMLAAWYRRYALEADWGAPDVRRVA